MGGDTPVDPTGFDPDETTPAARLPTAAQDPTKSDDLASVRERKRLANITRMSARLHRMVRDAQDSPLGLLKLLVTDDAGGAPIIKEFHQQWAFDVLSSKSVLHEASRGTTKSVSHSAFMLWFLGKKPELRCKILSDNDGNAKRRLRYIRELILKSDLLPLVFKNLRIDGDQPNNDHMLSVVRPSLAADPSVESYGVLSSGVGSRTDLLWLDDVCLAAGTLVYTERGVIPIEDVVVGDWVLNHTGTWSRVGETHSREAPTIGLKLTQIGDGLQATPNHPVLACLQTPAYVGDFAEPCFVTTAGLSRPPPNSKWWVAEPVPKPQELRLENLWEAVELEAGTRGQHREPTRACPTLDPEFWWMVGLWVAEGSLSSAKAGTGRSWTVAFAHHARETEFVERIRRVCARINRRVNVKVHTGTNAMRSTVSDKALFRFMEQFGRGAANKQIPSWVLDLPEAHLKQFAAGLWCGDGSRGPRCIFRYATVSKQLAAMYHLVLLRLGVPSSVPAGRNNARAFPGALPLYEMSIGSAFGPNVLGEPTPQSTHAKVKFAHGCLLRGVIVDELEVRSTVHNLTMDIGEHSYVSPGMASHNCSYRNVLAQPKLRLTVKEKILSEWMPTMTREASIWSTFTPWSVDDFNADMKKDNERWRYLLVRHGSRDDPCISVFPELWPEARLRQELRTLGRLNYARAYLCQALSSDTRLVVPEHLVPYTANILTPQVLARVVVAIIVDPASGDAKSKDPDYTGVTVLLIDNGPPFRVFVPEAFHFRASTRLQAAIVSALCTHWGASYLLIEKQGLSSLHEWVYAPPEGNPAPPAALCIPYTTTQNKALKLQAVTPLLDQALVSNPVVYFHPKVIEVNPTPTVLHEAFRYLLGVPAIQAAPEVEINRPLYDEAVNFGVTSHDDVIDPLSQGLLWVNTQIKPREYDEGGLEVVSLSI